MISFIPARSGSKSIPDKNIKLLGNRPLIAYTIETSLKCGFRTIVSTDSEEYAKIAREYGAEVLMRPPELAEDDTSMYQVLKSEIPKIDPIPEIVVLLQPTSPFRKTIHIKNMLSFFLANSEYDSAISVEKVPEKFNPAQVLIQTPLGSRMANGAPISNRKTRRQEFPNAFVPTGEIYIFKTSNLEKGNFYGENTMLYEKEPATNINSLEDWAEAEKQIKNG
jgi:N-acylneuraminate cytidylyltransferase